MQSAGFTQEDYYAQEALGSAEAAEPMTFVIALEYRLVDEGLEVRMPVSLMEEKGGGFIYRVQLLRSFGAAGADEEGYLVVPDGAGRDHPFQQREAFRRGLHPVHLRHRPDGQYLFTVLENTVPARLPLFGICRENSSVLATIERGATLCYLTADIAGKVNSYNSAYPSFILRRATISCRCSGSRARRLNFRSWKRTCTTKISPCATRC